MTGGDATRRFRADQPNSASRPEGVVFCWAAIGIAGRRARSALDHFPKFVAESAVLLMGHESGAAVWATFAAIRYVEALGLRSSPSNRSRSLANGVFAPWRLSHPRPIRTFYPAPLRARGSIVPSQRVAANGAHPACELAVRRRELGARSVYGSVAHGSAPGGESGDYALRATTVGRPDTFLARRKSCQSRATTRGNPRAAGAPYP